LKPRINIGIVFSKTWSLVKDALSTSWDAGQVPNIHEETELEHGPIYPVFADIKNLEMSLTDAFEMAASLFDRSELEKLLNSIKSLQTKKGNTYFTNYLSLLYIIIFILTKNLSTRVVFELLFIIFKID